MNRLGAETSPYLLQHAENPVDWYPWGEEAFERARIEDRPVLLSIGYAACHWCHVMEHESFEDEATASLMNERFVNIKVDREERPDVDGLYMEAVVAMTGQGGWPMTVFLTPDGRPFWGGTYFPPQPRMGMPGFSQVLLAVEHAYREKRGDLEKQAASLVDSLRQNATQQPSTEPLTTGLLTGATVALRRQFDSAHGGFGGAPKFPPASSLEFLLRMHHRNEAEDTLEMVRITLDSMAAGGMYDQLGGGFHRYSVDAVWLVPHFEKMLYDNALLAAAYLHGWVVTGTERYRDIVEETLDYLLRDMRLSEGGFASAQDADTNGEEGLTYTWTPDEIQALLSRNAADDVIARFGVTSQGNFEGRSIFHVAVPSVQVDSGVRDVLLAARSLRSQPLRDDKVLSGWNGLVLTAFAEAGRRLERTDYVSAATELAEFLLGPLSDDCGRLLHTFRNGQAKIGGYLEDYANVANGLLELYFATGAPRWLEEARRLADLAVEHFSDDGHGGFFISPDDGEELVARRKEFDDHPTPSGNSMMAFTLLRLARIFGEPDLERSAVGVFRVARPLIERAPGAVGHMLSALELYFSPPREIALVGESAELRRAAMSSFDPNAVYAFADGPEDAALERVPLLKGKSLVDGRAAAYVCESFACQAPVTDPEELRAILQDD